MNHRQIGYAMLSGRGLEIGGLHQPAQVPEHCEVEYWDAMSAEDAARMFPELDPLGFTPIDRVIDLDTPTFTATSGNTFDFVILNHVIEHVANPVRVIADIFHIAKPGGLVVISAPDKDFTFDKSRGLTSFEHLWEEYLGKVNEVSDEHYEDFLRAAHPETLGSEIAFRAALTAVRARREHAHVWDSETFRTFLRQCRENLLLDAKPLFECYGADTTLEYFGVWRKNATEGASIAVHDCDAVLENSCNAQLDLLRKNKALELALQAKDGHIHNLELALHDKDTHIRNTEAHNAQLIGAMGELESGNARMAEALAGVENLNAGLSKRVADLDDQLAAILNSKSWKITAPLRELKAQLSGNPT